MFSFSTKLQRRKRGVSYEQPSYGDNGRKLQPGTPRNSGINDAIASALKSDTYAPGTYIESRNGDTYRFDRIPDWARQESGIRIDSGPPKLVGKYFLTEQRATRSDGTYFTRWVKQPAEFGPRNEFGEAEYVRPQQQSTSGGKPGPPPPSSGPTSTGSSKPYWPEERTFFSSPHDEPPYDPSKTYYQPTSSPLPPSAPPPRSGLSPPTSWFHSPDAALRVDFMRQEHEARRQRDVEMAARQLEAIRNYDYANAIDTTIDAAATASQFIADTTATAGATLLALGAAALSYNTARSALVAQAPGAAVLPVAPTNLNIGVAYAVINQMLPAYLRTWAPLTIAASGGLEGGLNLLANGNVTLPGVDPTTRRGIAASAAAIRTNLPTLRGTGVTIATAFKEIFGSSQAVGDVNVSNISSPAEARTIGEILTGTSKRNSGAKRSSAPDTSSSLSMQGGGATQRYHSRRKRRSRMY